jgi:hypothetical protein
MKQILLVVAILLVWACSKPPQYPDEPVIEFINLSKDTLSQSDLNTDSLFVRISYTDGDGDLGFSDKDTSQSIFIIDTRSGFIQDRFKIPQIPDQGTANGIFGEMRILLFTTCCIFPQGIPPCSSPRQFPTDTVVYEIYIVDRAGNESNRIQTTPITLLCD